MSATETLVEALEKAGFPSAKAEEAMIRAFVAIPGDTRIPEARLIVTREAVAQDADDVFKVLARFASPEVKREVLRTLLGERLDAVVNWDGDVRFERYGNGVLLSRKEVLAALAPSVPR